PPEPGMMIVRKSPTGGDLLLTLPFAEPLDWPQLLHFFAARAIRGVEAVDLESYTRAVATDEGIAVVRVRRGDRRGALLLRVTGATPRSAMAIAASACRVFDVGADPARIARAFAGDARLAPLVHGRPGTRVPGAWDPFECAVRAVLGQQVSVAGARTFAARLVVRAGARVAAGALTHV